MAKKELETQPVLKTIEEWRSVKMPVKHFVGRFEAITGLPSVDFHQDKSWLYESAKILNQWLSGEVLTEEQFDAGLKKAEGYSAK